MTAGGAFANAPPRLPDPALEIDPFTLFERLRTRDAPRLLDVRPPGSSTPGGPTFMGARPWRGPEDLVDVPSPRPTSPHTVLFDDDGRRALAAVRRLRREGIEGVVALYGGLALYALALDPLVVGDDRFLTGHPPCLSC